MKAHISGFPELSPDYQLVFSRIIEIASSIFETHGFLKFETASVEKMDTLLSKGDDAEIYSLMRYHWHDECVSMVKASNLRAFNDRFDNNVNGIDNINSIGDIDNNSSEIDKIADFIKDRYSPEFGLRFDMTVPWARYVSQYSHLLKFPCRRYSLGQVWRGERPQFGRYRQFYQIDCDIINRELLSPWNDGEIISIIFSVFSQFAKHLPIGNFAIFVNNRKMLDGIIRGILWKNKVINALGDIDTSNILREIDKVDKLSKERWENALIKCGLNRGDVEFLLNLRNFKTVEQIKDFCEKNHIWHDALDDALDETRKVMTYLENFMKSNKCDAQDGGYIEIDPLLSRGLGYYTGTVYEVKILDAQDLGSVCGGGRYDNLISGLGSSSVFPGVGCSIGLSRLMTHITAWESRHAKYLGMKDIRAKENIVALSRDENIATTPRSERIEGDKGNKNSESNKCNKNSEVSELNCKSEQAHDQFHFMEERYKRDYEKIAKIKEGNKCKILIASSLSDIPDESSIATIFVIERALLEQNKSYLIQSYLDHGSMSKKLEYANNLKFTCVIFINSKSAKDDLDNRAIKVKNMQTGESKICIDISDVVSIIQGFEASRKFCV